MEGKATIILVLSCLIAVVLGSSEICPTIGIYTVANTKSCTKYYLCVNGQMLEQECATGLSFDREVGNCNLAVSTKCELSLCPNDSIGNIAMVANPHDCSKYYACSRGIATTMQCASGLLFNAKINVCDLADRVECTDETTPKQYEVECPSVGVSKLANPKDCSKYFMCINGKRADFKCTSDLMFDVRRNRCNFREISRCFK